MEKPTLTEFYKAMYSSHPFISFETVKKLYEEKYKVAEVATEKAPEVQTKKTKKKK
jgi:hypothetical protein